MTEICEDLKANPKLLFEVIFTSVDVCISMVTNALSAMEKDSKEGTIYGERSKGKRSVASFQQSRMLFLPYKIASFG